MKGVAMKLKLLASAVLATAALGLAAPASAGGYGYGQGGYAPPRWGYAPPPVVHRPHYGAYHGPHYRPHRHWARDAWIPGVILGGALLYSATRPVVVAPPAPVLVQPPGPVTYIERDPPAAAPAPAAWWYWCPEARGYYPHVAACPGGWQRVPAQPVPN